MITVQEIWLPAHGTSETLFHATAHCSAHGYTPDYIALQNFLHQHGVHAAHQPLGVIRSNNLSCTYHHGAAYQVYVIGTPEPVMDMCSMGDNEREKSTLEARRMQGSDNACRIFAVASGIFKHAPTHEHDIAGLTFHGHIALTGRA